MKTILLSGIGFALCYCPKCRKVYYNLSECKCDETFEEYMMDDKETITIKEAIDAINNKPKEV